MTSGASLLAVEPDQLVFPERQRELALHPAARAAGTTVDDIRAGMPATIVLASWVEGPATVVDFTRTKGGVVTSVTVRVEYAVGPERHIRFAWGCGTIPNADWVDQSVRALYGLTATKAYKRLRCGSATGAWFWNRRICLVGRAEPRSAELAAALDESVVDLYLARPRAMGPGNAALPHLPDLIRKLEEGGSTCEEWRALAEGEGTKMHALSRRDDRGFPRVPVCIPAAR